MREVIVSFVLLGFGVFMALDCAKRWRQKSVEVGSDTSFETEVIRKKEKPVLFLITMAGYSVITATWIIWSLRRTINSLR